MAHEVSMFKALKRLGSAFRSPEVRPLEERLRDLEARLGESERENVALRAENELLRAQNGELEGLLAASLAGEEALLARIEALEEKLNTSSRNSSRPASQDRPDQKPPSVKGGRLKASGKRSRGGQPGHRGRSRMAVPDERIDETISVPPPETCECGGAVEPRGKPWLMDQAELPPLKVTFRRYELGHGVCRGCGKTHRAALPPGVVPGLLGVNLLAFVGLLVGGYQLGRRGVARLLSTLLGLAVSVGTISRAEERLSDAMAPPYNEALDALTSAAALNLDETGSRRDGKRSWLWLAASASLTVFLLHASRGAAALNALLGDSFTGLVTSDRWHTYNRFLNHLRQVCWAHLLRDFQKIKDRGGLSWALGKALIDQALLMFDAWGRFRDGELTREQMKVELEPIRQEVERLLKRGAGFTRQKKTAETCKNLLKLEPALWTFVDHDELEPTNNRAERLIRNGVLWRKRSQGTWSERGDRYLERLLTVVVSLHLQQRNPLPWLAQALQAHHGLGERPTLLPSCTSLS